MLNPQLLKKIEDKIATRARRIKIGYFSVQCQQKHQAFARKSQCNNS